MDSEPIEKMKKGLLIACVALAFGGVAVSQNRRADGMDKWEGKAFPNVTLTTSEGKRITNRDMRGKVVLMDFFASWCGPCKAAKPKVQAMHNELGSKGLLVLGMNTWEQGPGGKPMTAAQYQAFTAKEKAESKSTFTYITNNDKLAEQLGVQGVPTFIVIDKKGVVREAMTGFNEARLKQVVTQLLAEK